MSDPIIVKTADLTPEQRLQITELTALCQKTDGVSVSYPMDMEDEALHYLMFSQGDPSQLCSILAVIPLDADTVECSAITSPAYRQSGCFSKLLELASDDFEDCDILFAVSEKLPDTLAVLDAIGADFDHCEHAMEFLVSEHSSDTTVSENFAEFLFKDPEFCLLYQDGPTIACSYHPAGSKASPSPSFLGSFCITTVSKDCLCLHQVEILSEFRGQGYGTRMIRRFLELLPASCIRKVILQVSGDNPAALSVYKNTGFRISETLSFYLY